MTRESADGQPKRRASLSTSRSLLVRVRNDEEEAWTRLVDLYSPLVCYWCRQNGLAEQDLPDVAQEVFQAVATNIERFRDDGPNSTFRGWLRTVARSKVADSFRKKGKEPDAAGGTDAQFRFNQLEDPHTGSVGNEVADENCEAALSEERRVLFRRALELIQQNFEDRTWNAFWKVAVEGRPAADVAEELNMKPGTVRVSRCRVLARLREEFGDLIEGGDQD
ncbi:MAG: RNA polymerase sigma factor [Planctomycetales bacterium]|jgi:RNA polymerase sigma-70 factor (ECF subfamily)